MIKGMRKLASDTLTRQRILNGVRDFAETYSKSETTYDIGGSYRYPYAECFGSYKTVNYDKKEKPDIVANAERLPFRTNSIKSLISVALLEHVDNPDRIVKEMFRVLAPKGHAFIWVPFYWREHKYPIDNLRFTKHGISSIFMRHGFKVTKADSAPYNGLFFVISHSFRFMMKDPHRCSSLNPMLYVHALLCRLEALDRWFGLRYPNLYIGVDLVVEK